MVWFAFLNAKATQAHKGVKKRNGAEQMSQKFAKATFARKGVIAETKKYRQEICHKWPGLDPGPSRSGFALDLP
jgi:hypothetical protein